MCLFFSILFFFPITDLFVVRLYLWDVRNEDKCCVVTHRSAVILDALLVACVAWRFWLGALSNKGGRGQRNREEIGAGATFYFSRGFAARSRALRARISRLRRSCARLDKTAMLRRLRCLACLRSHVLRAY